MSFHGSYRPEDVELLLTPLVLTDAPDVATKEFLIQSGQRHYSEMLTPESLPTPEYLALFESALARNAPRMAADCLQLAATLADRIEGEIVVVSLARAGTPVGAVLKHLLTSRFGRAAHHYSISIIRDRGIDATALDHIRQRHADNQLVFVDGWTGKGVITRELRASIERYNQDRCAQVSPHLYVLADLCGVAYSAATHDDYLIPSSILNATISGLVSRSILNHQIRPGQFHGCVAFTEFAGHDRSVAFVDALVARASALPLPLPTSESQQAQVCSDRSDAYVRSAQSRFDITDVNLIKPGIGEATRVLLRRVPDLLILRDLGNPDVAHLKQLAAEKRVPVSLDPALPYHAVSIIRSVKHGN